MGRVLWVGGHRDEGCGERGGGDGGREAGLGVEAQQREPVGRGLFVGLGGLDQVEGRTSPPSRPQVIGGSGLGRVTQGRTHALLRNLECPGGRFPPPPAPLSQRDGGVQSDVGAGVHKRLSGEGAEDGRGRSGGQGGLRRGGQLQQS